MAAAQRKRGWAAPFQGAEVVGEHHAANRGGVAIAGPLHISTSVPTEFESMLGEAAELAPESVEHLLHYLRSRILARHAHAMLTRGVTLVKIYLEPGMRASGLNLWLLEVFAACILYFDGAWIAMGDWNMEPKDLAQAGWLDTVNGKVFAPSAPTCAGGAGAVLDYFVLSEAMAHLVQQVELVDNSPTTPHSPVSLTLTATSWGHRVLARRRPKPFPRRCQWDRNARRSILIGPGQQRISLSTWSWCGWSGCAQQKQHGARSTTDPTEAFSGEEQRVGHRARFSRPGHAQRHEETLQQKGRNLARPATLGGAGGWQPGRLEEGANQHACFNFVTRPWPLGSRLGFSLARSSGTHSSQSCNLWGLGIPGHKGHGFHQESHATSSQCCGCRCGALLEAMGEGSLPGVGRRSTWLFQGRPRRRRGRWAGRAAAAGQAIGNVVAALVGFAQSQRQAAGRPGGCGRAFAKTFTRRGRRCVQEIQEHRWVGSRLHQPQGNFAAAGRFASTFHRPAHGFRGKAGQTFVLVSHDGFEAQAIRRSPHTWPHRCSVASAVAITEAAGAKVGERPRCRPLLGLPRQCM